MQLRTINLEPGMRLTKALLNRSGGVDAYVVATAASIVDDVRVRGDEALYEYSEKFDHVSEATLGALRVSEEEIAAAFGIPFIAGKH